MLHYLLKQIPSYRIRATLPSPDTLSELVIWLRGDGAENTGDGTPATDWLSLDEIYTFSPPVTANEPTYYGSGNNSRPTVSFTTDDYVQNLNQFFLSIGGTICIVFKVDGAGTYTLMSQNDISAVHRQFAVRVVGGYLNIIQKNFDVELSLTGSTALGTGWHLVTIHSNGTGILDRGLGARPGGSHPGGGSNVFIERLSARIDGSAEALTESGGSGWFGTPTSNKMYVGATISTTSNHLAGDIQHVIVFTPRLTTTQETLVETYLNRYSGL